MQSLIFATSFNGFEYNNDELPAPGRNLNFVETGNYWLDIPYHGRIEGLEKHVVVVDIAACFNIIVVLTGELTPIQGFELVLIHELVHACLNDEPYDKEYHTTFWNEVLVPLAQDYTSEFTNLDDKENHE